MTDELRALIETTRQDLVVLRDNHVHHLAQDLSTVKTDVAVIKEQVSGLQGFRDDIRSLILPYLRLSVAIVAAAAVIVLGTV